MNMGEKYEVDCIIGYNWVINFMINQRQKFILTYMGFRVINTLPQGKGGSYHDSEHSP